MKDPKKLVETAIQNKEPVFVLHAHDKCAVIALAAYNVACKVMGVNNEHVIETNEIYRLFMEWQFDHPEKVKLPD